MGERRNLEFQKLEKFRITNFLFSGVYPFFRLSCRSVIVSEYLFNAGISVSVCLSRWFF